MNVLHLQDRHALHRCAGLPYNDDPQMLAGVPEDAQVCWALQVLLLALRMQLDGIVPQIMSLPPHMLEGDAVRPGERQVLGLPADLLHAHGAGPCDGAASQR